MNDRLSKPISGRPWEAHANPPAPMPGASPEVAERLISEGLISLVEAAKLLPPVRGKRTSTSAIFRWIIRGKKGVKLEGINLSGTGFWTSRPALARFASSLTFQAQTRGTS